MPGFRMQGFSIDQVLAFYRFFVIVCRIMVVRMRSTRSRTGNRRSHHALKEPTLSKCSNCGAFGKPHVMCSECGFYNGRQVEDREAQKAKREARIQAKKERIRVEAAAPEPEGTESGEPVSTEDTNKEAREENTQTKRPEKKPE